MSTLSNSFFDSVIPDLAETRLIAPPVAAKTVRHAPRMSASLWQHTLDEYDGSRRHRLAVQGFFGAVAALGISSVAYALWQTCAVMNGSTFHDAVAAFLP